MPDKKLSPKKDAETVKVVKKPTAPVLKLASRSFIEAPGSQELPLAEPNKQNMEKTDPTTSQKHMDVVPVSAKRERVLRPSTEVQSNDTNEESKTTETVVPAAPEATPPPTSEQPEAAPTKTEDKPEPTENAEEPKTTPETLPVEADKEPAETNVKTDEPKPDQLKANSEGAKQEQKLKEYSENRQYYLPINAVAQKRSIKVSALLTLIVLILAIVLIDFMLDSGIILLLQKVPHTHFFSLSNN